MSTAPLCHHFDAGRCRSCSWLGLPYDVQLLDKQRQVETLLAAHDVAWLSPVASPQLGFRNKAKMVVHGTADDPTLGILNPAGSGVDLRDCPLHTPGIRAALPVLADFVTTARVTPYDVPARRGELKHLLVTESPDGELMVRWVLRSQEPVTRIQKHLPALRAALPALAVASVNLQPEHKAILEGDREILLTEQETLTMRVAGLDLHLRPQSFFQTNTAMAAELYERARAWVSEVGPGSVWDLYCGVGGFALALAGPAVDVIGVEVSTEAVASATLSAREAGVDATFVAGDATAYAVAAAAPPDLVVVNPPRRGIGAELAGWLETSGVQRVLYSSCNAQTLATDLAAMPSLRPVRGQLLDMFPNTGHYEVLTLLERR
ncbi:23S rRNA (uracil(747)-C(5))-methyltransferase RlmC [Nocardioides sp. MAH-18]|uniref:23S rRNA (Uracil(747)-C(5))-methyltransferase RlmC n=1 Tax=Nocardioides agri TaxID=2682843 RepID=A0A6L6XZF7_9ACTN|nr:MULTISPECIES: 23S rRNA (uracil(747)-C(5))-methyltransferase RlmC [unclassified Nocardioides]MBA2955915.1 23S rRNA (uracil(747)-C(5))-methyltransferase RlmC [Nocardioides sp. CGMCC 1.13656]MVQ50765.1 23S rRNA (uracil(747)-C(5))-methyltransferase RlmC [Nocardioides sp. MAH-18]